MPFSETEEGKRRASQTTDEIQQFAQGVIDKSLESVGMPDEIQPKGVVRSDWGIEHSLAKLEYDNLNFSFNETAYKAGCFDIDHAVRHEMGHLKRAVLTTNLSDNEKEEITKEYFTDLIMNGEYCEVAIVDAGDSHAVEVFTPPYLNKSMRKEFADFADENLYSYRLYSDKELTPLVRPIVEAHPEFMTDNGLEDKESAVQMLTKYSQSIATRYLDTLLNISAENNSLRINQELSPLGRTLAQGYCLATVELSETYPLTNYDGNKFLERYRYTEEELGVDRSALEGIIQSLRDELNALRQNPNYDKCKEAEIIDKINRYSLQTEFREKGRETLLAQKRANSTRNPIDQIRADSLREETSDLIESAKYFGYNEHHDEGEPTGFIYEET